MKGLGVLWVLRFCRDKKKTRACIEVCGMEPTPKVCRMMD